MEVLAYVLAAPETRVIAGILGWLCGLGAGFALVMVAR